MNFTKKDDEYNNNKVCGHFLVVLTKHQLKRTMLQLQIAYAG